MRPEENRSVLLIEGDLLIVHRNAVFFGRGADEPSEEGGQLRDPTEQDEADDEEEEDEDDELEDDLRPTREIPFFPV